MGPLVFLQRARRAIGRRRALLKSAAHISAAAWGSMALAFVGTIVAARALGPDEFGSVVLASAITFGVAIFLDLTFEEAVVHHGARSLAAGDFGGLLALVRRSLVVDGLVGLVVALLLFALAGTLADVASKGDLPTLLVQLATIQTLAVTLDSTTSAMLLVAGRPELRAWTMVVQSFFRMAGVVVAVQLGGAEAVMVAYVVAAFLASGFQCVIAWRVAWRPWASRAAVGTSPVSNLQLLRFALHSSFVTSLAAIHGSVYPLLLGRLAGTAAVGEFKVAMLPVTISDGASGPIRLLVLPRQAHMAAQNRYQNLRRAMKIYTNLGFALGIPAAVAGWFLIPHLIPFLYSEEFAGAVTAARILLVAAVCHLAFGWARNVHAAIGRPGFRSAITAATLTITLGLLVVFADRGSDGAALVYSAGAVLGGLSAMLTAQWLFRNPRHLPPPPEAVPPPGAAPVAAAEGSSGR